MAEQYSTEWKSTQNEKHGGWPQYHADFNGGMWRWHYIACDTERVRGSYFSKKECEADEQSTSALASVLGSKGGSSTSDAKKAASIENGKKGGRPKKIIAK
jgi:hypothetical protein